MSGFANPIGVFNREQLLAAYTKGWISGNVDPNSIGPSALDLVLGAKYWKLDASVRPAEDQSVEEALGFAHSFSPTRGDRITLKKNEVHVFRLKQELDLPTIVSGRATGKSSIGRLDVLTRLLCDRGTSFDEIRSGYKGPLYVEVIPNSFDIDVTIEKSSLNQLRLFWGEPQESLLTLKEALHCAPDGRILFCHQPFHGEDLDSRWARLRVSLDQNQWGAAAYCAKVNAPAAIDPSSEDDYYKANLFWDPVKPKEVDGRRTITLMADQFYILASKERFYIPTNLCVECRAYKETLGEYRIHYAGFAHPGFGLSRKGKGTPLILEVRPHSAAVKLFGHEPIAQVEFYRMSKDAEAEGSVYENQELRLSKYFKLGK